MKVTLLGYSIKIEKIITACSRATCKKESSDVLLGELSEEEARRLDGRVLSRGYEGFCPEGKKSRGFWKTKEFKSEREKYKERCANE